MRGLLRFYLLASVLFPAGKAGELSVLAELLQPAEGLFVLFPAFAKAGFLDAEVGELAAVLRVDGGFEDEFARVFREDFREA